MKPDWKDAPEWAKWLCRDSDGRWIWFEKKPRIQLSSGEWVQGRAIGDWMPASDANDNKWVDSLERRP